MDRGWQHALELDPDVEVLGHNWEFEPVVDWDGFGMHWGVMVPPALEHCIDMDIILFRVEGGMVCGDKGVPEGGCGVLLQAEAEKG